MLDPLYNLIGWLLAFFYGLVPNLGVAIILLTCSVMLVLFPLTAKQARAMLAMQEVQPELKKLQAKHKGDRAKLVEEQQRLFQEHKVNPLGGCLPLVAQFPVFISLFAVLRNTYKNIPTDSDLFAALCGADTVKQCSPNHLTFLGMDLTESALKVTGGLFAVLPYFVLVGLVVLAGVFQSRQTQRTAPAGGGNPQMMMIGKVLPIAFGVFSLWFPAGLVLYFLVSNVWRVGQQEVIFRKIHLPHRERQAAKQAGAKARPSDIDVVAKETVAKEPVAKETVAKETVAKETVAKETVAKETVAKEGAPEPAATTRAGLPEATGPTKPARVGGRFREMFGLPAPNGDPAPPGDRAPNGEPAPPAAAPSAGKPANPARPAPTGNGGSGGAARSNQARRRRNKKRKR